MAIKLVRGREYYDWMDQIKEWVKDGNLQKAEILLLEIVDFIEKYDHKDGVAPAYYEKLAIIYSKQKRIKDELLILERFAKQKHAPGVKPEKLMDRLEKLKAKIKE